MRSSSHSSGITAWQFAFIGFIEGECAKNRNLNPRKLDDIKMLREEFARLMGIDADTLSPLAVIRYETLRINHDIDTAIRDSTVSGKDRALNKLSQKGITKKHIKKRISKLLEIGAAMQIMNWTEIEPAGAGAEKLEPGAYVIRITEVSEHTSRKGDPYLTFLYDIAEGEHANHFAGETRDFTHSFNRSYTGNAQPFFRSLLDAFEQSNPGRFTVAGWQRTCDENAFVGLIVGALFRDRLYTSGRTGKDVTATDFVRAMPADDVRKGNWTVPPAKDDRDKPGVQDGYFAAPTAAQPGQAADSPYDADIPF